MNFRAWRDTIRPTLLFDVLQARIIIRKLNIEIVNGIAQFWRYRLLLFNSFSAFHEYRIANALLVVKG